MNIYIYKDYNHNPLGLMLSDSKEKVEIALAAMKEEYTTIEMIDPNVKDLGINGLVFVLTSKEKECTRVIDKKYRQWKRGR